jgi:hypothetical protein
MNKYKNLRVRMGFPDTLLVLNYNITGMVEDEMSRILPQYAEDVCPPSTPEGHFRISQPPVFTEYHSPFISCTSARCQTIINFSLTTTVAPYLVVCQNNAIEFKDKETSEDDETVDERIKGTTRLDGYRPLVLKRRCTFPGTTSRRSFVVG